MRAKTWAPVATFVVVAAVGSTAALLHDDPGGPSGPKTLQLATGGQGTPARAAAGSNGDYRLAVTLSGDRPADQRAFTLTSGPADTGVVTALARALKAGTPVRAGAGWRAGDLVVSGKAGQSWSWAPGGASASGGSVSSGGVATVLPASPVPAPSEPPPVPAGVVRAAARQILQAVGLDVADATIDTSPYGGSATLDRPGTVGMTTRVDVDRAGRVTSASGWLGTAQPGDSYPVVSAKDAFGRLPALAHPDICRLGPGGQGCLPPEPVVITGAELGLSLQPTSHVGTDGTTDGGSVLVPSWLFAVGNGTEVAVVAVELRYLAPPPTPKPGTVDPGPPVKVPPGQPNPNAS
ncbi:MAG: hypothetical protein JWP14_247 [Frankiales bacterium]|nr:hypothetical protein [Frankiales bacterium]